MLDQGNGITELEHSGVEVSDGVWHNVSLAFSSDAIQLVVDGKSASKKPVPGPQRFIDLTDR